MRRHRVYMKHAQREATLAVSRREFLGAGLVGSLLPGIALERTASEASERVTERTWIGELPLITTQPWQTPLYSHRTGGFPVWQDQDWEYAFTEKAAQDMKDAGVTAAMISVFQG